MKMMLHLILLVIIIAQIICGIHPLSYDWLNFITKPLIMPVIAFLFILASKGSDRTLKIRILSAILFSWAGDVILMFQEIEIWFIIGLLCFLIAQLLYLSAFLRPQFTVLAIPLIQKTPLIISPFLVFGYLVFTQLRQNLGDLKLPVLIYMLAILAMAIFALNRYGRASFRSFIMVFTGALLFVLSDLILAFNKFGEPIIWSGVWIMLTYISAQYLIALGTTVNSEVQQ